MEVRAFENANNVGISPNPSIVASFWFDASNKLTHFFSLSYYY